MNGMVHDTLCSCLESITVSDEAQSSFAAWGGSTSTCLMSVPVCEYEPALRAWFDFFFKDGCKAIRLATGFVVSLLIRNIEYTSRLL